MKGRFRMKSTIEGIVILASILIPAALFVILALNGQRAVEGLTRLILGY